MRKLRSLILVLLVCCIVGSSFVTSASATTEHDHVTCGEVNAMFHAYMTGGWAIIRHGNEHAIGCAAPVLEAWSEKWLRSFIIPWGWYQEFCAEDAHWTQYAMTFDADTMQEAKAIAARVSDDFILIRPDGTEEYLSVIRNPVRKVHMPDGSRLIRQNVGVIFRPEDLPPGDYTLIWNQYWDGVLESGFPLVTDFKMLACEDYH